MNRIILLSCSLLLNIFLIINQLQQDTCSTPPSDPGSSEPINARAYCERFDQQHRLQPDDLSARLVSVKDSDDDIYEWDLCQSKKTSEQMKEGHLNASTLPPLRYCPFHPTVEHQYQLRFFTDSDILQWPGFSDCVFLPPNTYRWPHKYVEYPLAQNHSAIFWPNLGFQSYHDVLMFNRKFPKNVYHFNAHVYDQNQEAALDLAAKYIPFGKKIRIMLEIGGGGGSLSISLNKRYDVIVLNTVRPEFPYCEYISERGGLCMLFDARRPMPFAKFTFDAIHHSWVYHGLSPRQWRTILLEHNRLLRPGGYLWMQDGSSRAVYETIKFLCIEQLGYRILYAVDQPRVSRTVTSFGSDPFEINWNIILMKPHRIKNVDLQCTSN